MSTKNQHFSFDKIFSKIIIYLPIGVLIHLIISLRSVKLELFTTNYTIHYGYVTLALIAALLPWFAHSQRIRNLTVFIGRPVHIRKCLKIAIGVDLGAAITPGAFGGSPVKVGLLMEEGIRAAQAISVTLWTSIEDFIFFTFAVISALFWVDKTFINKLIQVFHIPMKPYQVLGLIGGLIVLILIFTLLANKYERIILRYSWLRKLHKLLMESIQDIYNLMRIIIKRGKWLLFVNTVFAGVQWLSKYAVIYFLLLSLGIQTGFAEIFLIQVAIYILINLIPTPGAALGAESVFFIIFRPFVDAGVILPLTSAWRLLTFYLQLILGMSIFALFNFYKLKLKKEEA